jgi:endonuclease YncB( thermonuclease family)
VIETLPPDPPAITGRASVIDGDTIEIRGQRIRLWGIDAPEGRQTCSRGGENYRCGQEAALYLADQIGDQTVVCTPQGRPDRYRRVVARCIVIVTAKLGRAGPDLAAVMVANGHALDFPQYSRGAYLDFQGHAEDRRLGMWAGEFQRPWEWRAR